MTESNLFRIYGNREPMVRDVIKDCRELETQLAAIKKQNEGLLKRLEALENK